MDIAKIHAAVTNVQQGAWVRDLPFDEVGDLALKVRGLFNPDAQRVREMFLADVPEGEKDSLSPDQQDALVVTLICDALVVEWNVTSDGAPLPCTPETRRQVFTDPSIGKVMRAAALYAARHVAKLGKESLEADVKN